MTKAINSPSRNVEWRSQQLADGAQLVELINTGDAAGIKREKFAQDSAGNWFKAGVHIPTPMQAAPQGTGIIPYAG